MSDGKVSRRSLLGLSALMGVFGSSALTACSEPAAVPVPSDTDAKDIAEVVFIGDNFYEPQAVSIKPGQAVKWEWVGREQHDVVSADRSFVSELKREGSYIHIFTEAGEFAYICSIHPEMRGVVNVG